MSSNSRKYDEDDGIQRWMADGGCLKSEWQITEVFASGAMSFIIKCVMISTHAPACSGDWGRNA
jgi:hypothetical protein